MMKILALVIGIGCMMMVPQLKIGFAPGETGRTWRTLNDGVMGGLSQGVATPAETAMVFSGEVSLANNGGFASFRSPWQAQDLSDFSQIRIRARGTGIHFAFTLERYRPFYLPYFKQSITLEGEDWQEVVLPLSAFHAYRLGEQVGGAPTEEDLEEIIRIGFITNEKREGPFRLEIDWVQFE